MSRSTLALLDSWEFPLVPPWSGPPLVNHGSESSELTQGERHDRKT